MEADSDADGKGGYSAAVSRPIVVISVNLGACAVIIVGSVGAVLVSFAALTVFRTEAVEVDSPCVGCWSGMFRVCILGVCAADDGRVEAPEAALF